MTDDEIPVWKGDFTAEQTRTMARNGQAMPDGSYGIPDEVHLGKAIHAVGRGTNNSHDTIRRHIIRRAKALGQSSRIPDHWNTDGSVTKAEQVEKSAELIVDDAQHIVYGVVLTPGVEDSQGDIVSADEIEKAAHTWLVEYRKHDVQHSEVAKTDDGRPIAEPVESFCAPCDLTLGTQLVLKGSWVLGCRVNDPRLWDDVTTGKRSGFSIGGSGVREAIAEAA